jgi:spore coat protein JB
MEGNRPLEVAQLDPRQLEMLRCIMQLEFECIDLQLFLDTHPAEARALEEFRRYSDELCNAKKAYEDAYGPLLNYGFGRAPGGWQWICDPWPWEINWRRGA